MSNTSDMLGVFVGINSETIQIVDESKAKISVLDQGRIFYDNARIRFYDPECFKNCILAWA